MHIPHPDLIPLDSQQLSDWQAFYELYPFGEIREDFRSASMSFNIVRALTGNKQIKLTDFLLPEQIDQRTKRQRFIDNMKKWAGGGAK